MRIPEKKTATASCGGENHSSSPELLFEDDAPDRDAHGPVATKGERYVWVFTALRRK